MWVYDSWMDDAKRNIWIAEYETRIVETFGQEWPIIEIQKWERNLIGERRFVESRMVNLATLAMTAAARP